MKKNKNIAKINLKKHPYKGLVGEIAREEGVTQQAISYSIKVKNPRILTLVTKKIKERRNAINEYEKLCV